MPGVDNTPHMRRAVSLLLVVLFVVALPIPAYARPAWKVRIDKLVAGKAIGVAVREQDRFLYRHNAKRKKVPASTQKLLLSMALFDAMDPASRIKTVAAASVIQQPVLKGDLWLLGYGDPSVTGGGRFGRELPFEPTRLGALARAIKAAGVQRIEGSVLGSTGYFARDWWAPGWKGYFPSKYVPLPTALSFEGNTYRGDHINDPERRAAVALTRRLEAIDVTVVGRAGVGEAPAGLANVATIDSPTLSTMARYMNRRSSNFFAEVFGKKLGAVRAGAPGTIAKGAAAVAAWAARHGVSLTAHDGSGLSYDNRVAPAGIARLLDIAEDQSWGQALRSSLAKGDQGTLENRLGKVRLRAKTGTLTSISSLSGYVWLQRRDTWAEFAILSRGMSKSYAAALEDDIVRTLTRSAR